MRYVAGAMTFSLRGLGAAWERALAAIDRGVATGRRWPLVLLAFAFLLKAAYVLESADALYVRVPLLDARYYDAMAQDIARGVLREETFLAGPLYPYFLGLVYAVAGRDFMVVRLLQAIGGAATVMLAFLIGRRVFRPSVALAGAVLLALYGAATFYETELSAQWMGTLLDCAALWLLVSARGSPAVRPYAGAGAALGLSALAHANILLFALFALVWTLRGEPGARRRTAAFALAFFAVLLPVAIHNAVVSRSWVPVASDAGFNFYVGNGRAANGMFVPVPGADVAGDPTTRAYVEAQTGRDMSPAGVSEYWFARAFDDMRAAPGRAIALLARKAALYFNGYEVPHIESFDLHARASPWLRALFVRLWFIVPLALLGLVLGAGSWRGRGLLVGFVVCQAISVSLFFVAGRYRAETAPLLCLFAAQALVLLPSRVVTPRAAAAHAVALAALVLATSPGIFALDETMVTFRDHVHRARRLSEIGSHQPALREMDAAIALYPKETEGYLQRAIVHGAAHNDFMAIEDYQRALQIDDRDASVHYDLAQALRRVNLREPAVAEYRRAIDLDPGMAKAWNNMGIALREAGRLEEAIAAFERTIEVAPRYRRAYNNLGASYAEAGRPDEAIATFEDTVRRFPDYASGYRNLAMVYASQKRPRPALAAMRRYAALNPSDPDAAEMIRKLEIAARAEESTRN
jgi:tetratricopeptide (TPR) repeat protein